MNWMWIMMVLLSGVRLTAWKLVRWRSTLRPTLASTAFQPRRYLSASPEDSLPSVAQLRRQTISPSLQAHLTSTLTLSLRSVSSAKNSLTEDQIQQLSYSIIDKLRQELKPQEGNRELDEKGQCLIKSLSLLSSQELDNLLLHQHIDIPHLLQRYQDHIHANAHMFETIQQHHQRLLAEQSATQNWAQAVTQSASTLQPYAHAAQSMGTKHWVKEANRWLAAFTVSFFCHGGAVKHFQKTKGIRKFEHNGVYQHLRKDLTIQLPLPTPAAATKTVNVANRKLKVLDIGSCYNPLLSTPEAERLHITAIDLYPATDSVYQCDFLTVAIGPRGSEIVYSEDKKSIVQLPAGTFDMVCFSLVLSYLPSPALRSQMLAKARLLLKDRNEENDPHYAGLLLIVEKDSIFRVNRGGDKAAQSTTNPNHNHSRESSANNDDDDGSLLGTWRHTVIPSLGFQLVKYNYLQSSTKSAVQTDSRAPHSALRSKPSKRRAHAFAFCTTPNIPEEVKEQRWNQLKGLSIRQDSLPRSLRQTDEDEDEDDANRPAGDTNNGETTAELRSVQKNQQKDQPVLTRSPVIGIVGGGLAGAAFALALQQLQQQQHDQLHRKKHLAPHPRLLVSSPPPPVYLLFERDAAFTSRRQGYALTIQQAHKSLSSLGLSASLWSLGVASTVHYAYNSRGERLGAYGLAELRRQSHSRSHSHSHSHSYSLSQSHSNTGSTPLCPSTAEPDSSPLLYGGGRHNLHVPRQELRRLLYNNLDHQCIQWGKTLSRIEARPDCTPSDTSYPLSLHFQDGSKFDVDMVVGADGIFSRVRPYLQEQQQQQSRRSSGRGSRGSDVHYLHLIVILGISPRISAIEFTDGSPLTLPPDNNTLMNKEKEAVIYCQRQWLDGETRCFTMPFDHNHTMWQLSFPLTEAEAIRVSTAAIHDTNGHVHYEEENDQKVIKKQDRVTQQGAALKSLALHQLHNWDPVLIDLIRSTSDSNISGHPVYDRDPEALDDWQKNERSDHSSDHSSDSSSEEVSEEVNESTHLVPPNSRSAITLIGDAAHPMSPFKGQGANQALLDATSLSAALRQSQWYVHGGISIPDALSVYETEMLTRAREKVLKSREAAQFLHSPAALVKENITRAKAAELQMMRERGVQIEKKKTETE